jgi:hypothetical protein
MPIHVAVATKHGKLSQIAPAFEALKEWQLELALFDTDEFGTFSGEVDRSLSPRETVVEKAKAGATLLGLDFGIASEGTIGAHPQLPFINSDHELMAFVCMSENVALVESYLSADIVAHSREISRTTDFGELFRKLDLPNHAANIIVETKFGRHMNKGITDPVEAREIIEQLLEDEEIKVRVESDFRAMNSPTRQQNIYRCAQILAERVTATCPGCALFGWGRVGYEYGLPCRSCGLVCESVASAEKLGCLRCDFAELRSLGQDVIDPGKCEFCNP